MKENRNIFKNSIRKRRAISNISENGSHNESKEEQNRSKNSLKSFHRKTTSSCLYGSYLSFNLESELSNNLNIDEINNHQIYEEPKSKVKNLKKVNKAKEIDDELYDLSFHSYEKDNNGHNSVTSKIDEDKNNNNKDNGLKEDICDKNNNGQSITTENIIKTKENKYIEKSFVSFKNNLKYIKDKDERATQSYLLALGMTIKQNKKDEKEQYLPTTSVIEEEKSDMVESKSEFANTKNNILLEDSLNNSKSINEEYYTNKEKLKLQLNNNNLQQNNEYKRSTYININLKKTDYNRRRDEIENKFNLISVNKANKKTIKRNKNFLEGNEKLIKMSDALKEIIDKNNKKEESKRMRLKKNKDILLNSFFNMTYNGKNNKINESYNYEIKENNKTVFKNTEHSNNGEKLSRIEKELPFFHKKKLLNNSYISNILKNRYNTENNGEKTIYKKNNIIQKNEDSNFILNSENKNIKFKNLNDSINSNLNNNRTFIIEENKQINSQRSRINKIEYKPSYRIPHLRQKFIETKEIRSSINSINLNKNCTLNKKYLSKIMNIPHKKTHSFTKEKIFLNGRDKYNLYSMKQMKAINEALALIRIDRLSSKNKTKKLLKNLNSKNKNSNSSSFTGATRSNSKSFGSKEKRIIVHKANSGILNYKNGTFSNLLDENSFRPCNKKITIQTLKQELIYSRSYIKIDVLEKILKTFNSDNSFFIIVCEKYIKVDEYKGNNINDKINNGYKDESNDKFILLFKSLMKYYHNQNRFIKIYGDDNAQNVISMKNIDINNYYIYQTKYSIKQNKDKNKNDMHSSFELMNEFKFTSNAVILCKK